LSLLKVARAYLRQAEARLKDARDAFAEGNYPYAVRLSQECVELSLKAVLNNFASCKWNKPWSPRTLETEPRRNKPILIQAAC